MSTNSTPDKRQTGAALAAPGLGAIEYGDGITFEVVATRYRKAYGREEYLVRPASGTGEAWKRTENITWTKEPTH